MKDKKKNRVKTVVIVATAILVLMSMLPAMVSAQSDVKINEIMYNPSTEQGDDLDMEWIELYNNDMEAVNISGWTIDGEQIDDMVMEPGDYVVLARNKTAFDAYYGALPCSVIDVRVGLKNDPGDTIVLENSTGAEMDNVTYNASLGANGNGKTLERTATGDWVESTVDGGTPCAEKGETIVIPYSSWGPPVFYTSTITVDAMKPENVGKNATTMLFTATEMIDNVPYYVVSISKPTDISRRYISMDDTNEDYLLKWVVIKAAPGLEPPAPGPGAPTGPVKPEELEAAPGLEPVNLTFDPAFVMWDFPLEAGKTWTSTSNVTGSLLVSDDAIDTVNSTAEVLSKVTAEEVTVPLGTFPCLVVENNISYEVAGEPTSNLEKYWISPTDTGFLLFTKHQSYVNRELVGELELIAVIPPTFLNASDNNTTINARTGEFMVVTFETDNPGSTGYWWEVAELNEQVLRQIGDVVFVQDYAEPDRLVVSGKQIATFEVVGAGDATINMDYCSPGGTVEDTFTLNVTAS